MNCFFLTIRSSIPGRAGLLIAVTLALAFGAVSADTLSKGVEAYRKGQYRLALELWRPAAEQGDPEAEFYLSRLYAEGKGVARDEGAPMQWLKSSAGKGYPEAQFNLGNQYHQGTGVPEVPTLAVIWWRRAAEQGFAAAQYNLGRVYYYGEGVDEDRETAVRWFRLAAENGFERAREALTTLGLAVTEAAETDETEEVAPHPGSSEAAAGLSAESAELAEVRAEKEEPAGEGPADWIRSQPSEYFTFQLFASTGEGAALRYLEKWRIPEPVVTYRFHRSDELWSAVVWGSFGDRREAKTAILELPDGVRKDVWLRRFGELHAVLADQP